MQRSKQYQLSNIFDDSMGYSFEKIRRAINPLSPVDKDFVLRMLELVEETYDEFRSALIKREKVNDLNMTLNELDNYKYAIIFLKDYFLNETKSVDANKNAIIYEFYLRNQHEYFVEIAKEIDILYSKNL